MKAVLKSTSRMTLCCRWLCCFALAVSLGASWQGSVHAQSQSQYDPEFLDFQRSRVPTPDQLLNSLRVLQVMNDLQQQQANEALLDRIRDSRDELLSELTPEQQRNLVELGRRYLDRIDRGEQPEVPEALQQYLREQLSSDDLPESLRDMVENLPGGNPPRLPDTIRDNNRPDGSPQPRRIPDPFREDVQPGNIPGTEPGNRSSPISRERAEDLSRQFLERLQRFDENANPTPEIDPGVFEPRNNANTQIDIPDTGERVEVRFDRLLIEAAQRSRLNERGFGSRIAESMDGLFDGMISNIQSTIENHGSGSSGPAGWSSRVGDLMNSSSGGFWSALQGPSGGAAMPEVAQVSWWLLGGMALALVALLVWIGMRVFAEAESEFGDVYPRRRFRVPRVASPDDLVRAVDGYLLATFGRASQWWHARQAELALCSDQPQMRESIGELVECYEFARYSRAGAAALTSSQLDRCRAILKQISGRKTVSSEPAAEESPAS